MLMYCSVCGRRDGGHSAACVRGKEEAAVSSTSATLNTHDGGATSSYLGEVRFDLVPSAGIVAAARRAAFGAKRHGEWNWRKSVTRDFAIERLNHLNKHLLEFNEFFRQEDLDAIIFNAMMIAEFKKSGVLPEEEYIGGRKVVRDKKEEENGKDKT